MPRRTVFVLPLLAVGAVILFSQHGFPQSDHTPLPYELDSQWPQLPVGWNFQETPGVAVGPDQHVYVLHRGDHPIIDDTSWDASAVFFDARGYDSGRQWGIDQSAESGAEIIQSFLDAYPFMRVWWTPLGTIALGVIDPDDVDPDPTAHFDLAAFHEGGEVPFMPGDRREVYTHLSQPYMFSGAEQKSATFLRIAIRSAFMRRGFMAFSPNSNTVNGFVKST